MKNHLNLNKQSDLEKKISPFSDLKRTTKGLIASCILGSSIASATEINDKGVLDSSKNPNQMELFSQTQINLNSHFSSDIPHELLYISDEISKGKKEFTYNYSNSDELKNYKMGKIEVEEIFSEFVLMISYDNVDNDFPEKIMKFCPNFGKELINKLPGDSKFVDSLLIVNMINEYGLAYSKKNKK